MSPSFETDRRKFLASTGTAFAALAVNGCAPQSIASASTSAAAQYGPLREDPAGLLDLPEGFSYRVVSSLGEAMSDGGTVPDAADGMGCFDLGNGSIALVRNHELNPMQEAGAELSEGYGRWPDGRVFPGGTTNIVLDAETLEVKHQSRTLAGTIRNCSGGITPWGTWITCEEPGGRGLSMAKEHGYAFEVPASAQGLVDPVPLKAMGRFNHEAACVDPATGIVYMTEDAGDGLFYRFVPKVPGKLAEGGRLEALALVNGTRDASNKNVVAFATGVRSRVRWVPLDNVEAPDNDLRTRGAAQGALTFMRGEGLHMGEGELYFCCTGGGAAGFGQIFRLVIGAGRLPDQLELFFESTGPDQFNYGDNLCVAPNGHLVVCEDQYGEVVDNYLRGIDPAGNPYPLGRLRLQTELAGACFSPDGKTMFVNVYSPTKTLAITGPWAA